MHIYMAALHSNGYRHTNRYLKLNDHEKYIVDHLPHLLESYHYVHKPSFVNAIRERKDLVFLDSGAFSAYTLGVTLNLDDYCNYIKANKDIIRFEDNQIMASVMDGIGDPQLTYENQLYMESKGVRALPCFHAGEDERYLEYYISKYDYITLGGMVGAHTKQLIIWLDRIWEKYLTDGSGAPRLKVHGFGITAIPIMERYPWASVDSSSWIQSAAFGSVIEPTYGPLQVSEKSPSRHDWGQHVATLSPIEQQRVLKIFNSQGFSFERLSQVYESRAAYNLWAFSEINRHIDAVNTGRFICEQQELF